MKATELRIGNWVQDKHSEECGMIDVVVLGIIYDYPVNHLHPENHSYKPIPLTEEWLERFNWNPPKDIGVSFSLTTDEIHFVAGNYYKKIEYVHQLQNLYFALTGEELNQNKEDEA